MRNDTLIAIRWIWLSQPEDWTGSEKYLPPKKFLERERDSEHEHSCEVERVGEGWWAQSNSFGLVLDPKYPIRKVWGCDVFSKIGEHGLLEQGLIDEEDLDELEEFEASGWEETYRKFPNWRVKRPWNLFNKVFWSEGTFPPKPPIKAFAMVKEPDETVLTLWKYAKEVFGDLPIITVKPCPGAPTKEHIKTK